MGAMLHRWHAVYDLFQTPSDHRSDTVSLSCYPICHAATFYGQLAPSKESKLKGPVSTCLKKATVTSVYFLFLAFLGFFTEEAGSVPASSPLFPVLLLGRFLAEELEGLAGCFAAALGFTFFKALQMSGQSFHHNFWGMV